VCAQDKEAVLLQAHAATGAAASSITALQGQLREARTAAATAAGLRRQVEVLSGRLADVASQAAADTAAAEAAARAHAMTGAELVALQAAAQMVPALQVC
jgi:hypothetical protein